jgi:hypothetical protein
LEKCPKFSALRAKVATFYQFLALNRKIIRAKCELGVVNTAIKCIWLRAPSEIISASRLVVTSLAGDFYAYRNKISLLFF